MSWCHGGLAAVYFGCGDSDCLSSCCQELVRVSKYQVPGMNLEFPPGQEDSFFFKYLQSRGMRE